jgi:hypothetical protein
LTVLTKSSQDKNKEDRRSDLHTCACRRERQCERRGDLRKSS